MHQDLANAKRGASLEQILHSTYDVILMSILGSDPKNMLNSINRERRLQVWEDEDLEKKINLLEHIL